MFSLDLGEFSVKVRKDCLVPSSGWVGDIVIPISNVTGIWDIFLLSALFIASWTTIRLSDRIVALIIARVFDTTIPLQHYLNPKVQELHAAHCERYWSIWYIATGIEIAAYFLFHPDLFTLVTCFKTTAMVVLWHGRNADGIFWTMSSAVAKSNGVATKGPSAKQKEWNATLKAKEYTSTARSEMLRELTKLVSDEAETQVAKWAKADAEKVAETNKTYEAKAKAKAKAKKV